MTITPCTLRDYHEILSDLPAFWGSDRTRAFHHPMFVREFGDTAWVVRDAERVVAYLFAFWSQTEPIGYVHLVAVRSGYQRRGLARRLYKHFMERASRRGCGEIKAITTPTNGESVAFHTGIGMHMEGAPGAHGIAVVRDYSGPGEDRVVFRMSVKPAE